MDNNNKTDKIITELEKLNNYLSLLTIDQTIKIIEELKKSKVLTTPERIKMFILMDGQRSPADIAKMTKVSRRAVHLFVSDLSKKKLIKLRKEGRSLIPVKNYERIIEFLIRKGG